MASRNYEVLFCDFYGTLVTGDRSAVEETCARIVADLELEMTPVDLAVTWGRRFFDLIERRNDHAFMNLFDCECESLCATVEPFAGPIDPLPYARMLKDYWAAPPLAPHVRTALARLDVPVCIVSNADTEDITCAMERHRLPVDAVVTSEDARSYKPHPEIFRRALEKMGARPSEVLHIGDSLHSDVGGAQPLGIATCWVCYEDRILDVGTGRANHKIRDFSELSTII